MLTRAPRTSTASKMLRRALTLTTLLGIAQLAAMNVADAQTQISGWGSNNSGECNVPNLAPGVNYVQIAAGLFHSAALRSDGTIAAWGDNNSSQSSVPALPPGVSYVQVGCATYHTLACRSDGSGIGWGDNTFGQITLPAPPAGTSYVEMAGGEFHSLARFSDGTVAGFGYNGLGALNVPPLPPGLRYVEIASGRFHNLARLSDGSAVGWGVNGNGECTVPALPPGLSYVELAAGTSHSLARRSDGSVVAFGYNAAGECNVPALPPGLRYTAIAAGDELSVALRSDGIALAWGSNSFGQLNAPPPPAGYRFGELAAGAYHALARVESCVPPIVYCTAKVNSTGCTPAISVAGTPSASAASGFVVKAANVRNLKPGLLLYGVNGQSGSPFSGGFLCVHTPVKRGPATSSGGNPFPTNDCSGVYSIDMNAFAAGALGGSPLPALAIPGTVVDCQWWGRDPGFPAPNNATLSNAVEYMVCN